LSFYDNYHSLYKIKSAKYVFGGSACLFTAAGIITQRAAENNVIKNANVSNSLFAAKIYYSVAGLCVFGSLICTALEIKELKKITDKHKKIGFTGNGVIIYLDTQKK